MVTNRIDHKGFVTEFNRGTTTTIISGSTVAIENFAGIPGIEIYQATGSQAFSGDAVHSVVRFNGDLASVNKGLSYWDTTNYAFRPTKLNHVYSFRVNGILSASTGTPVWHLDLELSGAIPTGITSHHTSASINRQSHDFDVVRGANFDHSHFSFTGFILVNSDVLASGVQFFAATDGSQTVTIKSASLAFKEG